MRHIPVSLSSITKEEEKSLFLTLKQGGLTNNQIKKHMKILKQELKSNHKEVKKPKKILNFKEEFQKLKNGNRI